MDHLPFYNISPNNTMLLENGIIQNIIKYINFVNSNLFIIHTHHCLSPFTIQQSIDINLNNNNLQIFDSVRNFWGRVRPFYQIENNEPNKKNEKLFS